MLALSYDNFNFPLIIFNHEVLFEIVLKAGEKNLSSLFKAEYLTCSELFFLDHLNSCSVFYATSYDFCQIKKNQMFSLVRWSV